MSGARGSADLPVIQVSYSTPQAVITCQRVDMHPRLTTGMAAAGDDDDDSSPDNAPVGIHFSFSPGAGSITCPGLVFHATCVLRRSFPAHLV